jgi:glycosyltransferase involved in cell wall biosynthesis
MRHWTILTGEYPPDCGGVADYTAQIACSLAACGDRVTVIRPPTDNRLPADRGVDVVALPDRYGRTARRELARRLDDMPGPRRVMVQYVPNTFGGRGANIAWCLWLLQRSRRNGDDIRLMFHEPYFYLGWRPDRNALAVVQRLMAAILLRAAGQVYCSTEVWYRYLEPYAPRGWCRPITLPIPSTIPRCDRPADIPAVRGSLLTPGATRLVGHFGTYGAHIAPMLRSIIRRLLAADSHVCVVCIGAGSDRFVGESTRLQPGLSARLRAMGRLAPTEVALHLAACDLLVQPYPDGVTTRRTSVMAGLVNGRAVVTTAGVLTEPVWARTAAVALVPSGNAEAFVAHARTLLADNDAREALGARAEAAYQEHFALEHTIARLRSGSN